MIFLDTLDFKVIPSVFKTETCIRDKSDQPILDAAIAAKVDVLITGDKDFHALQIEKPKIVSAAQFLENYCD